MKLVGIFFLVALIFQVNSKTIRWTGTGGTESWDFARNWDCNCVPSASDDVIIDIPNIAGSVRIGGNPAEANSLTVGGVSGFTQTLYIQGPLTLGSEGGSIAANGFVILDAAPDSPFTTGGKFDSGSTIRMNFISGQLAGSGSFVFSGLNMTGPALKAINTTVTISSVLYIQPGAGQSAFVSVGKLAKFKISGTVYSSETTTVAVDEGGDFQVSGGVQFDATSDKSFTWRGYSFVANFSSSGGSTVLNDNIDFGNLNLGSGASLQLIGSPDIKRTIGSINGQGTVRVQGGTNTFKAGSIGTFNLVSGVAITDSALTINSLSISGGSFEGKGTVTVSSLTLNQAQLSAITINTQSIDFQGFAGLVAANIKISGAGKVSAASQLTMADGATLTVDTNGRVAQANAIKILQSGQDQPPQFVNEGSWTSNAELTIAVNTQGDGAWDLGQGSQTTVTGVAFNAGSLSVTSANLIVQSSVVNIASVSGSQGGSIDVSGKSFDSDSLKVPVYRQQVGATSFKTSDIGTLILQGGSVNVTSGGGGSIQTIDWQAGMISGPASGATLNSKNTTLSTREPKTLSYLTVYSSSIQSLCGQDSCQFFTDHAILATPTSGPTPSPTPTSSSTARRFHRFGYKL